MIVQELYRATWKVMPNGAVRRDSLGRYMLDYARGNFAGTPQTPVEMGFAEIPDRDGSDQQGPAELVHFAGWAYGRPVFTWHRQLPGDGGYALMLGVGAKQADDTWFASGTGGGGATVTPAPAPTTSGGVSMDESTIRRIVQEELAGALAEMPQRSAEALLALPAASDHYGLPADQQNDYRLQEYINFPVRAAVKAVLTDAAFLRDQMVPALDAATAP